MASRWLNRAGLTTAIAGFALVLGQGSAWATNIRAANGYVDPVTVVWTGNGTTNGACNNVGTAADLDPAPGQQGWLFILTQPFDNSGSQLSFSFSDGTASPPTVAGVHVGGGGGTYHYAVYTAAGPPTTTLISASATNGTGQSNLVVSHCEQGGGGEEDPDAALSSHVHLSDHTVIDNVSQGPNGATVHDSVTLTVTGVTVWTGTFTLNFFTSNDCSGEPADSVSFPWSNTDPTTRDDLLPQGPLGPGGYSYQESFNSDPDTLDAIGACEPFVLNESTTTPTTSPPPTTTDPGCDDEDCLPTTGASLTGFIAAGIALLIGGAALIFARRRRDLAAAGPGNPSSPE